MKMSLILGLGMTAVLAVACIPSVNPFYTTKDLRFEERLIGQWRGTNDDAPQTWTFEKSGTNEYELTIVEKENKTGKFHACLFELKKQYYLDLVPTECDYATNQAELVAFSCFPGHLLVRVPQLGPDIQLAFFDFDWLQKYLSANPNALACHREKERFILTASTSDLQNFVLKHGDKLFDGTNQMVRVNAQTAP